MVGVTAKINVTAHAAHIRARCVKTVTPDVDATADGGRCTTGSDRDTEPGTRPTCSTRAPARGPRALRPAPPHS